MILQIGTDAQIPNIPVAIVSDLRSVMCETCIVEFTSII